MQTAVDEFEQELEPLVQAQKPGGLGCRDRCQRRARAAARRGVEAGRCRALPSAERYAQLVEADRGGGGDGAARAARAPGASGERGRPARARPGRSHHRGRGASGLAVLAPPRAARAGATSTTTRSRRSCASRPTASERREAWDASKSIGPHAAPLVRELAHLRNEAARALGYRDHFVFSLTLDELDEAWLLGLLDDLDGRLAATWERTKAAIDAGPARAARPRRRRDAAALGLRRRVLPGRADGQRRSARGGARAPRPGRRSPRAYFQALGDDVDGVLARSDLYPRDGKNQHAFCADIDRRARRARARELRAGHALAGDDGARARARRLRPRDRLRAAVAAAPARAHVHDRGDRDAARAARARRDVPRALRGRRARDRARSAQRRDAAPRAARLRALGAGDDALRARALPRSGPGSRRALVAARRALPARRRRRPGRGPTTGPARSTSRWRRSTTTTTCSARSRPRSSTWALARETGAPSPAVEPAAAGRVPARALHAPGRRRCAGMR